MRLVVAALALGLLLATPAAGQSPPTPPRDEPDPAIVNGSAQRKLDTARRRWRRARVHNYRFQLDVLCFCAPRGEPNVLFVRGDHPVNPLATLRSVATIRRLHRQVQDAIDDEVASLSVRYDRRGIPRRIGIDGRRFIADDEVTYRIARFWRGTTGRGGPDEPAPAPR